MSLESYIENDPRVRAIHLFSNACFSLAVAILALSLTQIVFYIDKFKNTNIPSVTISSQINCPKTDKSDCKIETVSIQLKSDLENKESNEILKTDEHKLQPSPKETDEDKIDYSQRLIDSAVISLITAFAIAGTGFAALFFRKLISFAEIKNLMDYELNEIK